MLTCYKLMWWHFKIKFDVVRSVIHVLYEQIIYFWTDLFMFINSEVWTMKRHWVSDRCRGYFQPSPSGRAHVCTYLYLFSGTLFTGGEIVWHHKNLFHRVTLSLLEDTGCWNSRPRCSLTTEQLTTPLHVEMIHHLACLHAWNQL